jgi:hypothetical protein
MSPALVARGLLRVALATALQFLGWMWAFSEESHWPLLLTLGVSAAILTPMSLGPPRSWVDAWGNAMGITILGWLLGGGLWFVFMSHECQSHGSFCLG